MGKLYLVLGLVSLVIAVAAVALVVSQAPSISAMSAQLDETSRQLNKIEGQLVELTARTGPKTQKFTIIMGEGEVVSEVDEEEMITGEFHRWEPPVLVVKKGDTVELTSKGIKDPHEIEESHEYHMAMERWGLKIVKVGQELDWHVHFRPGETVTFELVFTTPGTYWYICGLLDATLPQTHADRGMFGQIVVQP